MNDEHVLTAVPVRKMAGIVGYRFACSCGREGNGWHNTEAKAIEAGRDHIKPNTTETRSP